MCRKGANGGRVVRWEVGKSGRIVRRQGWRVGKGGEGAGSEVARWERCKGSEVARWENGEVTRWEIPGFIQEWGTWVSPRCHLFVSDVDQQQNKGAE